MENNYSITQSRLLYVYSINDTKHNGLLKVGEVFVPNSDANYVDNGDEQQKAVIDILVKREYLKDYVNVTSDDAGDEVRTFKDIFKLEYVTKFNHILRPISKKGEEVKSEKCASVQDVHNVLINSNISYKYLVKPDDGDKKADIWFQTDLTTIKNAINAIKQGWNTLTENNENIPEPAIRFRPEQRDAIDRTVKYLADIKHKRFLWNAKMRFGKTLSGLQVAKERGYAATLILTHRPVVDKGWEEDFYKIFGNNPEYCFATRNEDGSGSSFSFADLTENVKENNKNKKIVFFASIQFLRLSTLVGGKNDDQLKKDILEYPWDFVIIDEAHEGTESKMGKRVIDLISKKKTTADFQRFDQATSSKSTNDELNEEVVNTNLADEFVGKLGNEAKEKLTDAQLKGPDILALSGTPFNLLDQYNSAAIYTWDYVMEQQAKRDWDNYHYGDPNPYDVLPKMNIFTLDLSNVVNDQDIAGNGTFNFHEFFRVWDDKKDKDKDGFQEGKFVHKDKVNAFLNRMVEANTHYPFSCQEFQEHFRHTFWLLPGVKEAKAMQELLQNHAVFRNGFKIVNAAGDAQIEDKNGKSLGDVQNAIRDTSYQYTITLSCGKLTTGVTVPEWTAIFYMCGSEHTPASTYMQAIFRAQSTASFNGEQKTGCYVFDFAANRALTVVAEASKMNVIASGKDDSNVLKLDPQKEKEHLEAFLELCPVVALDGAIMNRYPATELFEKLNNVYIERAVKSGYADNSIYNPAKLLNLSPEEEKVLGDVHGLLGSMPNMWKPSTIEINNQALAGTGGAEQVKIVYYFTDSNTTPSKPIKGSSTFSDGAPAPTDPDWVEDFDSKVVDEITPYCYSSHVELRNGIWGEYSEPFLFKKYKQPKDKDEAKNIRKKEAEEKRKRISILRCVAIRIPLLVFGADIPFDVDITIDNFASEVEIPNGKKKTKRIPLIDQASWEEFMPKGFTKATFITLKKCFDPTIFTGAARRIRELIKDVDELDIEERIKRIAEIHSYFHNPDKETVLTPWRVVNMQLSETVGGWCFFDNNFEDLHTEVDKDGNTLYIPREVNQGTVTEEVFGDLCSRILEINSKTGLYPLYMAYSMYRTKLLEWEKAGVSTTLSTKFRDKIGSLKEAYQTDDKLKAYKEKADDSWVIWKDVLQDNIFVVCRTPMAVSITKRTLAGFRTDVRMNVKCYTDEVPVGDLIKKGVLKETDTGVVWEGSGRTRTYKWNGCDTGMCEIANILSPCSGIAIATPSITPDYWNNRGLTFPYDSPKGYTLETNELDFLSKVDSFIGFPFSSWKCLGELHEEIDLILEDEKPQKPAEDEGTITLGELKARRDWLKALLKKLGLDPDKEERDPELIQKYWHIWDEYWRLVNLLDKYKGKPDDTKIPWPTGHDVLGEYVRQPEASYRPQIILYMKTIRKCAHSLYTLIQTYIHEMFHAYYDAIPKEPDYYVREVEEPLAELGALAFIEQFAPIAGEPKLLQHAIKSVEDKKYYVDICCYGFGAYLYNIPGGKNLIREWYDHRMQVSGYPNYAQKLANYKKMFRAGYPYMNETIALHRLLAIFCSEKCNQVNSDNKRCDMIEVLRAKSELFTSKVVQGKTFWNVYDQIQLKPKPKENIDNMKFNAIVGNPPYQEQIDENRSLAKQHFPIFIEIGILLNPLYLSLITPARWFTADAQDNSFPKLRDFVKKNNHFSKMLSYNGKKLFPSTELSTVCAFLWGRKYNGDVEFIEHFLGTDSMQRPLFESGLDIILPSNKQVSILKHVIANNFNPLNKISTGRDAFGIVGKDFDKKSSQTAFRNSITVQCAHEEIRYCGKTMVTKNLDILNSFKIFTSKGNGGAGLLTDGKPVTIIGKAYFAGPQTACTDSLIPFGKFKNKLEAENLKKYFATKFLRFMVGILKVSQNLYQNVYQFVPIQDFTSSSNIDWTKSIDNIDQQLYAKYNLSKDEIDFIEATIKPMP